MRDKVLGLLSISRKANKLCYAKDILDSFKYNKVHYVFIASDASDKTKERYIKKCLYYDRPYTVKYTSEEISTAIGKVGVMTIGIKDIGLANAIEDKEGGEENGQTSKKTHK